MTDIDGAMRDQPRVGGEFDGSGDGARLDAGSAPRGRGILNRTGESFDEPGISPAWAGNSRSLRLCFPLLADQPRVGGEFTGTGPQSASRMGSAPRGRGIRSRTVLSPLPAGISPAWAGNSSPVPGRIVKSRDQPRVGGEFAPPATGSRWRQGSAPRGRGILFDWDDRLDRPGISPAWAGNSGVAPPQPRV